MKTGWLTILAIIDKYDVTISHELDCTTIVGSVNERNSIVNNLNVCADDWTAERPIIASNVTYLKLLWYKPLLVGQN